MKKTLLCFLFLFTTVFYAQVSDIVHCSGDNNFDLSKQKIDLIGNLDPAQTTVSYHLSLADATNNVNAIANPSNYNTAASSTTIYARIDNNGTITTNSFNVRVTPALNIAATNTTIACKGDTSSLIITASGGGGQYYYSINNGGTFTSSNIFNNLSAGVYTIQVLDVAASCPTTTTYTITEPTTSLYMTVMIVGQNATITGIGGTASYQYSSDGIIYQPSNVFPNIVPGNYIFRVRDSQGCVAAVPAIVLPALNAAVAITKEMDCLSNASIAVAATGGQSPYTYSINGGAYQPSNVFNNLTAGTYSIVVKDAVNTTSNTTYITVATPVPVNGLFVRTNPTSCSTASITFIAQQGQSPFYYSIDNGTNYSSMNTFNLQPGTYIAFIRDSKYCVSSPYFVTIDPVQTLVATATNTPILCQNTESTLTANAIGGQPPYQYSINNGAYTVTNSYTTKAGTYNVKVKDNNGCIAQLEYVITEPAIVFGDILIEGQTISVIDMQGGTGSYMYALDQNNFQTNNVFSNVAPGIHVVRVKDSNNCEPGTFSAVIEDPNSLISSSTITKQIDCLSNATITTTAIGGQLPYQYSIDGGITYVTSNIFNNLTAGTYTVTVKDALNAISQTNTIIIAPLLSVTATAVITKTTNCGDSDTVTITATSGKAPYLYSFDGSNTFTTVNTATGLTAGAHSLFVKDANGCLTDLSIVIAPSSSLSATITTTNPYCSQSNDGRISLIATGGTAPYTYSIGNGYASSNIFNNLSAGYYNVSVKDALGCLYTMVAAIVEPTILSMTVVTTNSTTSADDDGTITLNATGGVGPYAYAITYNNGTPPISFQPSTIFTGLKAGSYDVYVKDTNGCITFQTNIVVNKHNPLLATTTVTPTTCLNPVGTLTIHATGGTIPYQYSLDNGANYVSSNVFNLVPGNYSITVRDIQNTTTTIPATIADLKPVFITATLLSAVSCNGASNGSIKATVIQAQAPYVYKLDNADFYDSNAEYTFNNLSAGEHTIQVIDNNSCTSFVSITIPEPTILNSTVAVNDKTISVNTTGGVPPYSYTLQDNDTGATITGPQTSNVFTNLPTGIYSVQVIDSTICSLLKTGINISNSNALSASFSVSPITCNNPTGTITVVATGGSGSYEYSLDNGVNYTSSTVFTGLTPGTYNINVKDSQNTTTTIPATISPLQPLLADAVLTKTIDCLSNASLNVIASGGKKPYQYSFDNGLTYNANNTFTNINAGTYFIQVKDSLDCTVTTNSIVIEQPIPLYANFATTDGTITTNVTGGIAPYSYALTDNSGSTVIPFQNSNIFTGLTNGSYGVEVRDATGCTYIKTDITIVNKPNSLLATTAVTPTTCLNPTGTITISVSGGKAPYQYSLDNGVNYISTNVFTGLTPGTYNIKVRDANNNTTSIVAVITPVNAPAISATVNSNILCKGDNTGSITAVATGGQSPYIYSLDGITFNTTNAFTNLRVGTFNITVKDTNGCTAATTIVLTEPAENLSATAILINDQGIIVNAKGGTAPYKYYLQNNNGIVVAGPQTDGIFTRLPIGRYSAQVTDANGCGYIHWSVDVVQAPSLSATVQVDSIKCNATGIITVNATGGFQPYYYSFDNGATYTNSNVYSSFKPGTYAIKVRDYQNTIFSITAVITQGSVPVINITATNINCKGETSGSITANVTGGLAPYTYSLDNGPYINGNSSMTFTNLYADTHNITVKDTNGCLTTTQVVITEPASALMTVTTVKNQTITINASGGTGNYRYAISPNLDNFSTNNVFSGLTPRSYIVNTSDVNGCYITMNALVDPPAPLINGQIKLTLEFKLGQTLADLIIDGQNIKWYINQNPLAGKTSRTSEIPLPLTTVIVEGTTYYASQTINGIESTERMAVTVKSSTLGTNDLVIKNFTYYPNPVKNVLMISNDTIIDEVAFISIKGETLLTKKINGLRSEIDLSNFSKGVYFLKVKTEGTEKTVKLIKE
jgi:hypothetical protein